MQQNQYFIDESSIYHPALICAAGLMGAAGVAAGALAAHQAGGGPLETASHYLLFHAGPVLAIGLNSYKSKLFNVAASLIVIGALLFSVDLALRALANVKPFALAAPAGGIILILGWLMLAIAVIFRSRTGRPLR